MASSIFKLWWKGILFGLIMGITGLIFGLIVPFTSLETMISNSNFEFTLGLAIIIIFIIIPIIKGKLIEIIAKV